MSWQHDYVGPSRLIPRHAETTRDAETARDAAMLASDADRDAAAALLNESFAEGRLTVDEHGERVRGAYAARTWAGLAELTADLPGQAGAAVARRPAGQAPASVDRCLLCALLIMCPPAGIAWLLTARRRQRADLAQTLAAGHAFPGRTAAGTMAGDARHAENR